MTEYFINEARAEITVIIQTNKKRGEYLSPSDCASRYHAHRYHIGPVHARLSYFWYVNRLIGTLYSVRYEGTLIYRLQGW